MYAPRFRGGGIDQHGTPTFLKAGRFVLIARFAKRTSIDLLTRSLKGAGAWSQGKLGQLEAYFILKAARKREKWYANRHSGSTKNLTEFAAQSDPDTEKNILRRSLQRKSAWVWHHMWYTPVGGKNAFE